MQQPSDRRGFLFATCFIALIATSGGFMVRAMLLNGPWKEMFDLSGTQVGEIFGAGLWPFAISIVLFSLVIDKIGYKTAMWFAVICHLIQAFMLMTAGRYSSIGMTDPAAIAQANENGYWWLWIGSFVGALGNGTIEAVINPVIATVYSKQKTRMLTMLHAGWPGGLVLAGLLALMTKSFGWSWEVQVGVLLLPVAIYAIMLFGTSFPVNERVAAGIPYLTMLRQAGVLGAFIVVGLIVMEIGRVFGIESGTTNFWILALVMIYGFAIGGALGRTLFFLLLLLMIPLATVELGTDAWISGLMRPVMEGFGLDGVWVLIYTSTIMIIMRTVVIGPLSKIWSPVAILAVSALFAATGIYLLGSVTGAVLVLVVATIYGMGQAFFWPCTLGLVSEQFPEGGALTINSIAGVGMLGVGIIGGPLLGNLQDTRIDEELASNQVVYEQFMADGMNDSIFGEYRQLDGGMITAAEERVKELETPDQVLGEAQDAELASLTAKLNLITEVKNEANGYVLRSASVPALYMAFCYFALLIWFRQQGGYKPVELNS